MARGFPSKDEQSDSEMLKQESSETLMATRDGKKGGQKGHTHLHTPKVKRQ